MSAAPGSPRRPPPLRLEVAEASGVGAVRRGAADFAARLGFSGPRVSDVAIVATELATNLVKHVGHGEVLVSAPDAGTLNLLAIDRGAGMARPQDVLRDGYSTAGTPGTGLGAVERLSSAVDLYSAPGRGTVVWARLGAVQNAAPPHFDVGAVHVPYPGEVVSGDGWATLVGPSSVRLLLVDGLGHGPHARHAAQVAELSFAETAHLRPGEALEAIHSALRPTRGAVGLVVELDNGGRRVRSCGIGNVTGALVTPESRHGLLSHNGTLGQEVRRFAEMETAWAPGAALVVHSDGLSGSWNLAHYPGLLTRASSVIAGVLYRDFARGRDDATVVVIQAPR